MFHVKLNKSNQQGRASEYLYRREAQRASLPTAPGGRMSNTQARTRTRAERVNK